MKKCKITEVNEKGNYISYNELLGEDEIPKNEINYKICDIVILGEDEIIKNEIKHKICDMIILREDDIENIKKMSYTSLLELHLLIILYSNYMIEFFENDEMKIKL